MLEKITNAAERLATGVAESRRGFFARLGKLALGAAGAVVGLLALPTAAQAGQMDKHCCVYSYTCGSRGGGTYTVCPASSCPGVVRAPCGGQAQLVRKAHVSTCTAGCV
jgi:hypothetical protein